MRQLPKGRGRGPNGRPGKVPATFNSRRRPIRHPFDLLRRLCLGRSHSNLGLELFDHRCRLPRELNGRSRSDRSCTRREAAASLRLFCEAADSRATP